MPARLAWARNGGQAPGTLHHVIVRGIEKRRIVDDKVDQDNFVLRMGQVAHETETVIYAWEELLCRTQNDCLLIYLYLLPLILLKALTLL